MAGKFPPVDQLANLLNRTVQQSQQSTSMIGWHMLSEHMSQKRWWQQQQKEWSIFLGSNTVDGWNPATWDVKNLANNGINYQPQLVCRISSINSMNLGSVPPRVSQEFETPITPITTLPNYPAPELSCGTLSLRKSRWLSKKTPECV